MFLHKTRKHYRSLRRFAGLLTDNPVLTLGLALPFVIGATFSLQAAVCVLIGTACSMLPMMLLASLIRGRLPGWACTPIFAIGSMLILIPVGDTLARLFPVTLNSMGIYFPIIAVSTLTLYSCDRRAIRGKPLLALRTALLELAGFAVVILSTACVRELFGNGTLWGVEIPAVSFQIDGLLIPFGGFFVVAFIAAATKYFGRLIRTAQYRADVRHRPADGAPREAVRAEVKN